MDIYTHCFSHSVLYDSTTLADSTIDHVRLNESSLNANFRPQIRRDDPLNLSISVSGGKETNKDSPSNGE